MQRTEMTAELRHATGKGVARQLRRQGKIPAILYGAKTAPLPLSVSPQQLRTALVSGGANVLITLKIEGDGAGSTPRVVMLKDYQLDPIKRMMLHADLYEVRMDQPITIEVPIRLTGRAEGVKAGGILEQVHRSITVECLPDRIPDAIEIDVTPLAIGQSLHASDLKLQEGVRLRTAADETLVTIVAPAAEIAATPEEQAAELAKSLAGPTAEAKPAAVAPARGATAPAKSGGAPSGGGKK